MRSHLIKLLVALCAVGWPLMTSAAERVPLVLEARIPLGDMKGRIDHLAVDVAQRRLFVAELGNNTVGAIDIDARKVVRRLEGFDQPQGVADDADNIRVDRDQGRLYVAGDGSLAIIDAAAFEKVGEIALKGHPESFQLYSSIRAATTSMWRAARVR